MFQQYRVNSTQEPVRPAWVIEQSLNWHLFDCCGDEDLFPFKCHACGCPLVLCYECDTLYTDLHNLSIRRFFVADDSCPRCAAGFDDDFMRSSRHRIDFDEWHDAGLDQLLVDLSIREWRDLLTAMASRLVELLRRGMRSTARWYITEYRNLSESLAVHFPRAAEFRHQGNDAVQSSTLSRAMKWHSEIDDPIDQAYAVLGITDVIIP